MTLSDELRLAAHAAREGGRAAMRFYGTATVRNADARAPVTEADRASNDAILEVLAGRPQGDAILSEEQADSPERLDASRVWIVDPLDGTKEFLAQNGEFAVMVGLAVDGEAVVGAVYQPADDRMFLAARGEGAFLEERGERSGLAAPTSRGRVRLVGSRSHADALTQQIIERLDIEDVRPSGSVGVKCGLIARGECNLYVHPVPYLKEWDTCAPEIVLREAGGQVTDCTGEPLRYNKPTPVQPDGILASAPGVPLAALQAVLDVYADAARA